MEYMILGLLYTSLISMLLYYYFCRCCSVIFRWYGGFTYVVLSCALSVLRAMEWIGGCFFVVIGILLLTVCGLVFQRCSFLKPLVLSSLTISVYSNIDGVIQSLTYFVISHINSEMILKYADLVRYVIVIGLLVLSLRIVIRPFLENKKNVRLLVMLVLIIPLLFMILVEAMLSESIYGNTIVWDTEVGLVFPIINNAELLIVRLLACASLCTVLFIYHKLEAAIESEQRILLLEQLTRNQETYVSEAQLRYEQTRSFRHDIKNHLLVVHELLKGGNSDEANEYLQNIGAVSDALSYPVNTGNTIVDVLLSNKLAIAAEKDIQVHCSVRIPKQGDISEMDWCILLSNALDNAINACEAVMVQDRYLSLTGRQKGNIYFLNIENCCQNFIKLPSEGIGLSNIKAVLHKYGGKVEIEVTDNTFKLNLLFLISQQA